MRIWIDTQVIIWFADWPNSQLGPQTLGYLADPGNRVLVSAISFREIALEVRIGKLDIGGATLPGMIASFQERGFDYLGLEPGHLLALQRLPRREINGREHRDPFDHLLFAQAIAEDVALMSSDVAATIYSLREILDPRL